MRGLYGSETSHLDHLTRALSSQTSMSHLVPLLEFNHLGEVVGTDSFTGQQKGQP